MKIKIEAIPHNRHRYPTVGDWYFDKRGTLVIRVSRMGNWRYEMLVAVHELVEVLICKHRGVSQKSVDKFDKAFEANRKPGDESEPGDDPKAPYRREHFFATNIESLLSSELDVDWAKYEKKIYSLP